MAISARLISRLRIDDHRPCAFLDREVFTGGVRVVEQEEAPAQTRLHV